MGCKAGVDWGTFREGIIFSTLIKAATAQKIKMGREREGKKPYSFTGSSQWEEERERERAAAAPVL